MNSKPRSKVGDLHLRHAAVDDDRRKFWKLRADEAKLMLAQGIRDSELAALELAIRRAEREGLVNEVRALSGLRDRLLAAMPRPHARRTEADAEAVLEAHGFASRPGPQVRAGPWRDVPSTPL